MTARILGIVLFIVAGIWAGRAAVPVALQWQLGAFATGIWSLEERTKVLEQFRAEASNRMEGIERSVEVLEDSMRLHQQ